MAFKDHFSGHADRYARYRPEYRRALFDDLAQLTPRREWTLDCATGSGQAAIGLAMQFERVVATDGGIQQLQHARSHPKVSYVWLGPASSYGEKLSALWNSPDAVRSVVWPLHVRVGRPE